MAQRRTRVRWLLMAGALLALTGCRAEPPADHGGEIPASADSAVDCVSSPVYAQGHGDYDGGLEKVTGDARDSLESLLPYVDQLPEVDLDEVARHDGKALFTWSSDGSTLAAFVVRDGMDDVEGNHGWGVTSYIVCDPAEWPAANSEEIGLQLWSNADGDRVPMSLVYSMAGSPDCGGPEMTFLYLGTHQRFYGNPDDAFQPYAAVPYAAHTEVPAEARDTGYQRSGQELWVTPDAAYLAAADGDAERWPAPDQQVGCG